MVGVRTHLSASGSLTVIQSKTSPARVLKVFPERADDTGEMQQASSQGPGKKTELQSYRESTLSTNPAEQVPRPPLQERGNQGREERTLAHRHVTRTSWAVIACSVAVTDGY